MVNGLGLMAFLDCRGMLGSKESRNEASESSCLIFNAMAMKSLSFTPAAGSWRGIIEKVKVVSSRKSSLHTK